MKYTVIAVGGVYDGYELGTYDDIADAVDKAREEEQHFILGVAIIDDEGELVEY